MVSKHDDSKRPLDLVTNPFIGEFSIGAYTMTSLSVSGSNLFDFESKKSRVGTESINVNDAYSDQAQNSNDRASNTAIASCSINTYQLSTEKRSMNSSVVPLTGSLK